MRLAAAVTAFCLVTTLHAVSIRFAEILGDVFYPNAHFYLFFYNRVHNAFIMDYKPKIRRRKVHMGFENPF